jgi:YVTN family beta-propeller protein
MVARRHGAHSGLSPSGLKPLIVACAICAASGAIALSAYALRASILPRPGIGTSASTQPTVALAPQAEVAVATSPTVPSQESSVVVPPSSSAHLKRVATLTGRFTPKSIVAAQNGLVFAQNMIYTHTISVFDERTHRLLRTIKDGVRLSDFGFKGLTSPVKGGPVEAAVTPDKRFVYVSNYSMYGPGFSHPGSDAGGPGSGTDRSFVYRIPMDTLRIDQVIRVGSVPKFLAVTPDGRYLLVTNWVSFTMSVVDTATGRELREIKLGRHPRGIAVAPDSSIAYVAVMGSTSIAAVDLRDFSITWIRNVGVSPRHLVMSPDGRYLYATLNGSERVVKISLATRKVVDSVRTGEQPRSMTIAPDGLSLYVVNYTSGTMSKVRTKDMVKTQDVTVSMHPIGITYVDSTREVWVSCYRGAIIVFSDR